MRDAQDTQPRDGLASLSGSDDDLPSDPATPGFGNRIVTARELGVGAGVDQVAERLLAQRPDGRDDLLPLADAAAVDEHHALVADLRGDVRATADQHVDVLLHMHDFDAVHLDDLGPWLGERSERRHLLSLHGNRRRNGKGENCQTGFHLDLHSRAVYSRAFFGISASIFFSLSSYSG